MNTFVLEDDTVRLEPLTLENYHNLYGVAGEKDLVQYSSSDIDTPEKLKNYVETALYELKNKTAISFIVFDKRRKKYAGCTRYMNINYTNKVLEIGSTWIGKEFQETGLNTSMKCLMIDHAFDVMGFEKVEFRIDERNIRSRKAVEKLGSTLEGILRKNVYLKNGYKRNTCCYGILKEEWKAQL